MQSHYPKNQWRLLELFIACFAISLCVGEALLYFAGKINPHVYAIANTAGIVAYALVRRFVFPPGEPR
jgi:hypothetical protein